MTPTGAAARIVAGRSGDLHGGHVEAHASAELVVIGDYAGNMHWLALLPRYFNFNTAI